MEADNSTVIDALNAWAARRWRGAGIEGVRRLTGGASRPMWAFELHRPGAVPSVEALVLRLAGVWNDDGGLRPADEARLLEAVAAQDVPVPGVRYVLGAGDGLGEGYIMQRLDGETLPSRILRDDTYAGAREVLARQCGRVLAGIHEVPLEAVPFLRYRDIDTVLNELYDEHRRYGMPRPVFELAFRWLFDHRPSDPPAPTLVHGDFRNGNLMINRHGLHAVLDWELAGLGDPMADLGWLCVNSWRFGNSDWPVGGFGSREELFAGYREASGRPVCASTVAFWELFGSLKWGVICERMAAAFRDGLDRGVERGAIGRRASEVEIDLLERLAPPRVAVGGPG